MCFVKYVSLASSMAVFFLTFLFSNDATAGQPVTRVDWLGGYVSATSKGYAKETGTPMDTDNAIDAAKVLAQADLLAAVKDVRVDRKTTIAELMEEQTETTTRIQGVLRNAFQAGEARITNENGYVVATVEMRVCLYNEGFGCQSDMPLANALSHGNRIGVAARPASCDLTPDMESSREALAKLPPAIATSNLFFLVNVNGSPINSANRDFSIMYETGSGEKCSLYAPDRVDPAVRRDRGTAEIFLHEEDGIEKYGGGTITFASLGVNNKNQVTVSKPDAYLMNIINESKKDALFREARVGIAMDRRGR